MSHIFQDQLLIQVQKSEYNAACTAGMFLAHFRIIFFEFLNKEPEIVTEEALLIVLYSKSVVFLDKNGKDTKHTRHIERIFYFLKNDEKCKMHNI